MQLSEALREVSKNYVNGTIEFYSGMKNDPWQAAHDRLEGTLALYQNSPDYFNKQDIPCREFVREITKLIETYKTLIPEQPSLPSAFDAFAIGDEDKVRALQSLEDLSCATCGEKDSVRAGHHLKKGPGIYCQPCFENT